MTSMDWDKLKVFHAAAEAGIVVDRSLVAISRTVLYAQAILIVVVAGAAFWTKPLRSWRHFSCPFWFTAMRYDGRKVPK